MCGALRSPCMHNVSTGVHEDLKDNATAILRKEFFLEESLSDCNALRRWGLLQRTSSSPFWKTWKRCLPGGHHKLIAMSNSRLIVTMISINDGHALTSYVDLRAVNFQLNILGTTESPPNLAELLASDLTSTASGTWRSSSDVAYAFAGQTLHQHFRNRQNINKYQLSDPNVVGVSKSRAIDNSLTIGGRRRICRSGQLRAPLNK